MVMRKPIISPSLSSEEKIDKLSKVVERLGRRSVKVTSAIVTPVPISNCVIGEDVRGEILRYLFCCPGNLNKGGIFLNKKPESGALVKLEIFNDLDGESKGYSISRRNLIFAPDIEVDTWNRLVVSLSSVNPEEKITEAWIALLWTPSVKDATVKSYLIDEIEESVDDLLEE
uniref:Uncharacterized protein n=1 Tax=viral metagenome TaxID=1070528 RepID=A0A6H1ZVD4_9ZZZZ